METNDPNNAPVAEMAKVRNVKSTELLHGAQAVTMADGFVILVPWNLCIMHTHNGHTHAFIWED